MTTYQHFHLEWDGIAISLRWASDWYRSGCGHLEFISEGREPMPVSETGYRSHFVPAAFVESNGGPLGYAKQLLEIEAVQSNWYAREHERRQLSLF